MGLMGDIHYVKDLPAVQYVIEADRTPPVLYVTESLFARIGDYTRSMPTGPSAGRIYKKNLNWDDPENPNWWAWITEPDDEPGMIIHRPHRLIIGLPLGPAPRSTIEAMVDVLSVLEAGIEAWDDHGLKSVANINAKAAIRFEFDDGSAFYAYFKEANDG